MNLPNQPLYNIAEVLKCTSFKPNVKGLGRNRTKTEYCSFVKQKSLSNCFRPSFEYKIVLAKAHLNKLHVIKVTIT